MPLRDLIEQTNPHLPANVLSHIQRVRTARSQSADPTLRAGLMRIPMHAAHLDSTGPTPFYAKTRLGPIDILKVVGVIIAIITLYSTSAFLSALLATTLNTPELLGFIPCLIVLLGPAGFFMTRWRFNVRRARTRTEPLLARGFRPFQPTLPEVEVQIAWAKLSGISIASRLNAESIHLLSTSLADTSLCNANELQFDEWGRKIILDHQIQDAFDRAIESEQLNRSPGDDSTSSRDDAD